MRVNSIFQENSLPETVEYLECDGSIHFSGVVSSSVFMYPKATVSETIAAVKQDIIRSLASRFTMHCDALIDDNLLPEGENVPLKYRNKVTHPDPISFVTYNTSILNPFWDVFINMDIAHT